LHAQHIDSFVCLKIIEKYFELRSYERSIVAETVVDGEFDVVGNEGFRRLAAYINGKNCKKQSISMTAPVSQERAGRAWRIAFLMPSKYTMETLPEPLDERIALKEVSGRLMAVVRYSGTWSRKRYEKKLALLLEWVRKRGWSSSGTPVWARYDPPFMPWFMRRNEVLIAVEEVSQ
jgi:hypothetical protein